MGGYCTATIVKYISSVKNQMETLCNPVAHLSLTDVSNISDYVTFCIFPVMPSLLYFFIHN